MISQCSGRSLVMRDRLPRSSRTLRSTVLFTGLIILSTAAVSPAPAQSDFDEVISIQAANQLETYYDTAVDETVMDDRLDVSVTRGPFALGATFLVHSPTDRGTLDPNDYIDRTTGVRKRWLEITTPEYKARVGDVYTTFGRGLALAVFEDQTVDFDNALDGFYGNANYRDFLDLEVITGTNSIGEPLVGYKGAQLKANVSTGSVVGIEGVWSDLIKVEPNVTSPVGDRLLGGFAGTSFANVDFYGEYVQRDYEDVANDASEPANGHAAYTNLTFYLGRLQILTEFKEFRRYTLVGSGTDASGPPIQFINPPTANRSHSSTLFNRGSHVANLNFEDEHGGLVEAFFTLAQHTRLSGSYGKSEASDGGYPSWEGYGDIEHWFGDTEIVLRAGEIEETILEGANDIFFERLTYSATIVKPLTDVYSVDVTVETQETQESNRATASSRFPFDYRSSIVSATLNRSPNMSWGLNYEWSDDPKETRESWLWAEWNLQLGSRHQLLIGGGQLRGGQLCSGGICKLVDPFEGAKVEFLTTF